MNCPPAWWDPHPTHCCSQMVGYGGILLFPWSPVGQGVTPTPGWIIRLLPEPCCPNWNWLPSSSLLFLPQVKAVFHPQLPPPSPSAEEGHLHLPTRGVHQPPWPTTAQPLGTWSLATIIPLLVWSFNKSEHSTQSLVRVSKHWEERQEEASFPDDDMSEWEREPSSRMAQQGRGRPSVKSQRPGA